MKRERRDEPRLRAISQAARRSWPEGATAGVLLVAAACVGLSITLYQLAGPRDVFAAEARR
jgi:hypothetical protein